MRSELTPTEMAEHLAKRKELWEARETAKTSRSFEGRGNTGFASETAQTTGVSKRTVQQAVSRADAIPLSVRAKIKGTKLDTGVYLDSLKKLSADKQWVNADLDALRRGADKSNQSKSAASASDSNGCPAGTKAYA